MTKTDTDFSRNRDLATKVKLGVSHIRPQTMMCNWLLNPEMSQAEADFAVRVVEACARTSGTDLNRPGDWDALAHCMTVSLMLVSTQWFLNYSGYMANQPPQTVPDMVRSVFGTRFKGQPIVSEFDKQGNAVKTIPSVV
ncbi:hypothetical protein EEDFHM_04072 [Methylorubrum populi]